MGLIDLHSLSRAPLSLSSTALASQFGSGKSTNSTNMEGYKDKIQMDTLQTQNLQQKEDNHEI